MSERGDKIVDLSDELWATMVSHELDWSETGTLLTNLIGLFMNQIPKDKREAALGLIISGSKRFTELMDRENPTEANDTQH